MVAPETSDLTINNLLPSSPELICMLVKILKPEVWGSVPEGCPQSQGQWGEEREESDVRGMGLGEAEK